MMTLIDSGADYSSINIGIAKSLGIDIDSLPKDKTTGIGGQAEIAWVDLDISFGQRGHDYNLRMPFHIILSESNKTDPIIGREPFFHRFDISFRIAYAPPLGKFVLSEVTRHRDPKRYIKPDKKKKGSRR